MPNASTTQTSSASETTGTPIALAYGYVWVTGKRHAYYQLLNTGISKLDFTRVGIWLLGHGEWDGPIENWINDALVSKGDTTVVSTDFGHNWVGCLDNPNQPMVFNFHRGSDSLIGAGLTPSSVGPDQSVDQLFAQFPAAVQPLAFSRIAYYAIMRKQPIENQTNTHQNDPTQWTDINPVGMWRALRCRLFDDQGNQTGYAFTTNPAWHFVDVLLRRKLFPDYGLDLSAGPDAIPTAVANRFDWGTIFTAAQYFDEILSNGRRRFEGNYVFSQQTSLQAVLEQILLNCRSFMKEYAGKISLNCDMPRASVFTFTREHILPGSWSASDQTLHTTANRFVSNFRDLLVPQCSAIASIAWDPSLGQLIVTTVDPHPLEPDDWIAIGGTNSPYDGEWQVGTVPDVIDVGTPEEVDPSTFTLVPKGENYPVVVGAGGGLGLLYSRFKERSPEFWHKNNMLARGVVGLGIPRQRNKVKQVLDFATATWDQVSRLTTYERDRLLGVDQSPYITPPVVKFRTSMFAKDAAGNLACGIEPGDHVTLDDTVNFQYAGEYEVLEPLLKIPPTAAVSGAGVAIVRVPDENSGEIEIPLGPYNPDVFYDTSDPDQAGWPSVPGSDPGNSSNFTSIPLASGQFAFFTGVGASGSAFQLPSTGFPPANVMDWAGPGGYLYSDTNLQTIKLCSIDSGLRLLLQYQDGSGNIWNGDTNYACLTWLSADVPSSSGGLSWLELTLLGGEKVIFGQGVVAGDGSFTVALPAGYTSTQMLAVAFPHDGTPTGNHAHWVGAYVDSGGVVHLNYKDGEGNVWNGNAAVLVFAWKNNIGSWSTETIDGNTWAQCTLTSGQIFGVGVAKGMADGSTLEIPSAPGVLETLEAMVGTSGWDYPDNGDPATGVKQCYLDADLVVHINFGNTFGSVIWPGAADIFALYCTTGSAVPTSVTVAPSTASVAAGSTQLFTATVLNNANPNVTWSVDGIAGGNLTVGTIDASGNYSAPGTAGAHTVTATSLGDPTASGSAAINVWGSVLTPSILTDDLGNAITTGGADIDVV